MPPVADWTPLFGQISGHWSYWVHLPILIIVVSLVYAGTRYDDWPNIFKEARRWVVRLVGFLGAVVLVLYVLALLTP
jgi:hypothetical protein